MSDPRLPADAAAEPPTAQLLAHEESIEQAYFFRTFGERIDDNRPAQEVLRTVGEEILATTKLPLAIEFVAGEVERRGLMHPAMERLGHYFAPFQTFVIARAEEDDSRFPFRTALEVLQAEAEYRAGLHEASDGRGRRSGTQATPAGLFTFQFEAIARNRLGYAEGLAAMAGDPLYWTPDERGRELGPHWRRWLSGLAHRIGTTDFGDLVYGRSEQFVVDRRRMLGESGWEPPQPTLFGQQEGRIAKANRGRDPLYMFAALQRQLGYPRVPRIARKSRERQLDPEIELRFQRLESKLLMLEQEQKGSLDLSEFMAKEMQTGPELRKGPDGKPRFDD